MLRYILYDTCVFEQSRGRTDYEKDLCWGLEFLTQINQTYLKYHPNAPRLYRSGVFWSTPKQLDGDCEEVHVLTEALGSAARSKDVSRVLDKVQDVFGGEHFCDIGRILEYGDIDCDGLCCWRVAELRQRGIPARPFMTSRERLGGGTTYHALVIWPALVGCNYETSEDPSLLLGMHQPERAAERLLEIQKNIERSDILRRYGRDAVLSSRAPANDGTLEAAVADLLGVAFERAA